MNFLRNDTVQEFIEDRLAVAGMGVLLLFILLAAYPRIIAPQNPYDLAALDLEDSYRPPGGKFILGTDDQGRDIFSAILYGLRISLFVGVVSTALSAVIGMAAGLLAGYSGKWIERLIMRLADIQLSLPVFLVALVIMAVWGQGVGKIIIAITVCNWVYYARTVRGVVMSEKQADYVQAAVAGGQHPVMIMFSEIAPNTLAPVIVIATVRVANAILLEATLSFLGVGVPITRPSLGSLISNGFEVLFSGYWWMSVFPGLVLMLLVLAINLMGDRLRDVLNPRLKR
ncbi:MAG: ABC transporter permease [Desulfobacterales bacterium]